MNNSAKKIWVCWEKPLKDFGNNDVVLSFLKPSEEELWRQEIDERLICGAEFSQQIRDKAVRLYVDLVADCGLVKNSKGETFRHALKCGQASSAWWFHKVSEKDCEEDSTFDQIIQVMTVIAYSENINASSLILYGADEEIKKVLTSSFQITALATKKSKSLWAECFKQFLRRIKFGFRTWKEIRIVSENLPQSNSIGDIVISGFWDWSFKKNTKTGTLEDRYFRDLPKSLLNQGKTVSWFAWFDHRFEPNQPKQTIKESIQSLKGETLVVIVQSFLSAWDVVRCVFSVREILVWLKFGSLSSFKKSFIRGKVNWYPIFEAPLWIGFFDYTIPRHRLIFTAHQRFAEKYRPKIVLTFLDLFLYARAVYDGIRQGNADSKVMTMQHASCSREKIFYVVDSKREIKAQPDQCSMPQPDIIFAMGKLGREIFLENGFTLTQTLPTGSARYDHISFLKDITIKEIRKPVKILIVTSLDISIEILMVDTVFAALAHRNDVQIFLRFHPFGDIRQHPDFKTFQSKIICTQGTSLDQDLESVDLVVCSYSTVGEESLLKGIPVWHWTGVGYNASVFRDLQVVPCFASVKKLRELFQELIEKPSVFIPEEDQRKELGEKCFFLGDARPSERISAYLAQTLENDFR